MRQIVEAIDQNPPGLSTVISEDPQLRKLAQMLPATTVSWRTHSDVTVSGGQLVDVAIDLVHELDLMQKWQRPHQPRPKPV